MLGKLEFTTNTKSKQKVSIIKFMDGKYDSKFLANDTCICTVLYL